MLRPGSRSGATYYCTWRQQCGLQTAGLDVLGLYVGNLRAGANLRHLGSVCWQPTTALGGNNLGFKLQGWGQLEASWVCMLATYSTWRQPCGALNCRAGANLRHLGSVCWQPTALGGNHVGFKLQGWGQLEASWVCMLATYSTWRQPCGL